MAKTWKAWTPEEDAWLRENYSVSDTEELCRNLSRSAVSIGHRGRFLGVVSARTRRTNSIAHGYFTQIKRPIQAYILGLLTADGSVGKADNKIRLILHEREIDLLNLVQSELAPLVRPKKVRQRKAIELSFNSPQIKHDLAQYGVTPAKTSVLGWPTALAPQWYSPYILGYFDGDGSLSFSKRVVHVTFYGALDFLQSASEAIEQATGIKAYGPKRVRPNSKSYRIEYTCVRAKTVLSWLNKDFQGLARKRL